MNNFKLLGIRPRAGCHRKLLKNLSGEQLYQFYSSFKFYNKTGSPVDRTEGEVFYYDYISEVPSDLYQLPTPHNHRPQEIQFNVSAIAGKNGSGKSSLIDLFFAGIFTVCARKDILTPTITKIHDQIKSAEATIRDLKVRTKELQKTRNGFERAFNDSIAGKPPKTDFAEAERAVKEQKRREDILAQRMKYANDDLVEQKKKLNEYSIMSDRTKVDIYYQVDHNVFLLSIKPDSQGGIHLLKIPSQEQASTSQEPIEIEISKSTLSKNFFYSIAINYSHYAMNSSYVGDWIRFLFHKNDGYQTPLVINPMRTGGNFDINDEMNFARTRLLVNVLLQRLHLGKSNEEEVKLTENQSVTQVVFTLNKAKVARFTKGVTFEDGRLSGDVRSTQLLKEYFKIALPEYSDFNFKDFALRDILLNYIVYKIDKISSNYDGFKPGYVYESENENELFKEEVKRSKLQNTELLKKIAEDNTHVTWKLHQATNFIRYIVTSEGITEFDVRAEDLKGNKRIQFPFKLMDLFEWTGTPKDEQLIEYLPPSIFEVDFRISNSKGHSYWFSGLSSGEQQIVHTIQSIIYHINNILSAHRSADRIKYQAVNIILDEVELYFHPDFQRQFISRLLQEIAHLPFPDKKSITTMNLLFLTHSPFILSDIPNENVLRLEFNKSKGKAYPVKVAEKDQSKQETFAANMHDLLANSFFINGTSMGQFAEEKINVLIDKVNNQEKLSATDHQLIQLIGDKFLRISLEQVIEQK